MQEFLPPAARGSLVAQSAYGAVQQWLAASPVRMLGHGPEPRPEAEPEPDSITAWFNCEHPCCISHAPATLALAGLPAVPATPCCPLLRCIYP